MDLGWGMLSLGRDTRGLKTGLGKQLSPVVLRPLGWGVVGGGNAI